MAKKETTKNAGKKPSTRKKTAKKEEPIVNEQVFEEAAPAEEVAPVSEEKLEVINGDPAVLVEPVIDEPAVDESETAEESASIEENKPEPSVDEDPSPLAKKVVHHIENKPKRNIIRRVVDYLWNGQEMDY